MILIIDNFDSFTWNLVDYVKRTGEKIKLLRNDIPPHQLNSLEFKGVILSPGPGQPTEAGYLLDYINYFERKIPILGICLGHQAIGHYYGSDIVKALEPKHGKVSEVSFDNSHPLFANLPSKFKVVRYHSLIINNLPESIKTIATTENIIMAISHKTLPIYGIQFHPEAFLTENGPQIIRNWIDLCRKLVVE